MDKAKAAANDLAAKADSKMAGAGLGGPGAAGSSREADRYLRDLGVLAYLDASGRPAPAEDRDRVLDALRGMDAAGALGTLTLQTAAPPPPGAGAPPPPGGSAPPPPGGSAPPPPGGTAPPPPPGGPGPSAAAGAEPVVATESTETQQPTAPPPPPPAWTGGDSGDPGGKPA